MRRARRSAMSIPVPLRTDFEAVALRRAAKATKDAAQGRRLLALAEVYDGGTRTDAARIGGVGLQTVRDWVLAFNQDGPAGLINGKAPGQPSKLNDDQRRALARMVEDGPIPAIHGVVRWRLKDLAWWVHEEFRISLDETTVGRELRKLGFRKLSARPQHDGQNEAALEEFKKLCRPGWARSRRSSRPAPPSNSGGRTRPGSARRTGSPVAGLGAELALAAPHDQRTQ